jgi:hypothetical protein
VAFLENVPINSLVNCSFLSFTAKLAEKENKEGLEGESYPFSHFEQYFRP